MNDLGLEDNIQQSGNAYHQQVVDSDHTSLRGSRTTFKSAHRAKPHDSGEEEEQLEHYPAEKGVQNPDVHWRQHMRSLVNGKDLKAEEKQESGLYQSTVWWMTSTAFPLFAGTFGPISNLFSVCALVQTWRVRIEEGSRIPDPKWLTGLNATSLFLALGANLVLMFNFARRIRYALAQPITITLWYISCILLLICIGLVNNDDIVPHQHPSTTTYTQSYYYGLISCIVYFTVATLLPVSSLGSVIFHAYPPSFATLTGPQRTLMLQTTSFALYLALGAGIFSTLEEWDFVDGVYWADYTLLTIGLGTDFPLHRVLSKVLLIPYSAFGITLVGLVVSSVRGLVLERAKAKVVRRHLGQQRERWRENIERKASIAARKGTSESAGLLGTLFHLGCLRHFREKRLKKMDRKLTEHATIPLKSKAQLGTWHRAEFELMRLIEKNSARTERYNGLLMSFFVILIVWIGGSLVFWSCEKKAQEWTYIDSFYFSYTTLLTIGYGDFYPSTSASKPFFVLWSLISVPAMTILISNMGDTVVKGVQDATVRISKWTILPERPLISDHLHKNNSKSEARGQTDKRSSSNSRDGKCQSLTTISSAASYGPAEQGSQSPRYPQRSPRQQSRTGSEMNALEGGAELLGNKVGDFEQSENRGDSLAARLAREISRVAKDLRQKPPKRYSWEEWSEFLDLLGMREGAGADKDSLRSRQIGGPRGQGSSPLAPQGADVHSLPTEKMGVNAVEHRGSSHSVDAHSLSSRQRLGQRDPTHSTSLPVSDQAAVPQRDISNSSATNNNWNWSWLDDQGPLFSPLTETEWLIGKLCFRLEEVLEDEILEARAAAGAKAAS